MRVLIFAALYRPYRGGYVESIHELSRRLVRAGHGVTVITCNTHGRPAEENVDGILVRRVRCWNPAWLNGSFPFPHPGDIWRVLRMTKRESIDVVSTQTRFFVLTWIGFFFAKCRRLPVVHTERGATHSVSANRLVSFCASFLDHTFGWLVARFSSATVGVSDEACAFLRHLGARHPVKIVNGITVSDWQSPRPTRGDRKRIMTFVGRLVYGKGVQDGIAALVQIRPRYPSLQFWIIGDGPYRVALEALVKGHGVSDSVVFFGEQDQAQIRTSLSESDVLVNPSYSEGLPRSVLEAAAAGLPIVATEVGGTKEIVANSSLGRLVLPHRVEALVAALDEVLAHPAEAEQLGQNIQRYVQEHFDWSAILGQYEALFLTLRSRVYDG